MTAPSMPSPRAKAELVERSALARLQLRRDAMALRDSVRWKRAAAGFAAAPVARAAAVGLVLAVIGASRASRLLAIAGPLVMAARLSTALVLAVRTVRSRRDVRHRTDATRPSP